MNNFLLDNCKIYKSNNESKRINIKERKCKNKEIEQCKCTTFQLKMTSDVLLNLWKQLRAVGIKVMLT